METVTLALVGVVLVLSFVAYYFVQGNGAGNGNEKVQALSAVGLHESQYQKFRLTQKTQITANTVLFRFALAHPSQRVGLPVGKHMLLRFIDAEGKSVSRPYTPVSSDNDLGYFDLLIKLYPLGKMSQHLLAMQVGDSIEARGPQGSLEYLAPGSFKITRAGGRVQVNNNVQAIGMIAGGSGITPMLQILREVHRNTTKDQTRLSLLFANVTEEDILLRSELEALKEARSLTDITYTLDKPAATWTGQKGFVTTEMIKTYLPPPSSNTLILLCGPKPMVDGMEKNLLSLGYTEDMYFKY